MVGKKIQTYAYDSLNTQSKLACSALNYLANHTAHSNIPFKHYVEII